MVHAGISILSTDNRTMWGTAHNIDSLGPGIFEFVYDLAVVPLRPGAYRWRFYPGDESEMLAFSTTVRETKIRRSSFPPPHHPLSRRDAVYFRSGVYKNHGAIE
jgi:hypothetical protein